MAEIACFSKRRRRTGTFSISKVTDESVMTALPETSWLPTKKAKWTFPPSSPIFGLYVGNFPAYAKRAFFTWMRAFSFPSLCGRECARFFIPG